MIGPGVFYNLKPTKNAYGGIGTGNDAFVYPFTIPATSYAGVGVANIKCINTVGPEQSYFQQQYTNAPAQGAGNIAGTVEYTALLTNLYSYQQNTVTL